MVCWSLKLFLVTDIRRWVFSHRFSSSFVDYNTSQIVRLVKLSSPAFYFQSRMKGASVFHNGYPPTEERVFC